ncbi:MAG: DUF1573 domain-containing protein [Kiritimatiellaeota bacterium]|nr:DUF1573 domain-containing protein [Kiritimatiellota bacterium]
MRSGCGCAVIDLARKILAPGQRTELRTRLVLKGLRGPFRKRFSVRSNASNAPRLDLWVTGSVVYDLTLEPVRVNFGAIPPNADLTREVVLSGRKKAGVNITAVRTETPVIQVEREVDGGGRCSRFLIHTAPPLPAGVFRATVFVSTDFPKYRRLEVGVAAFVLPEVRIVPRVLVFRGVPARPVWRRLLLLPGSETEFHVLSVRVPVKGAKVEIQSRTVGPSKILLTNLRVSADLDGKTIHIKTDLPKMKDIEVPIRVLP